MAKRLTDIEIRARICPTRLRWPPADTNTGWTALQDCVDALHALAHGLDNNCLAVEQDTDLTPAAIAKRREAAGQQALAELNKFAPFLKAQRTVESNIASLEGRMVDLPQPPANAVEAMLCEEIRRFVNKQEPPRANFVLANLADRRIAQAVLTAPHYLSGLTETEQNVIRAKARSALHPVQTDMQSKLNKAMAELTEAMAATRRLILERCDLREEHDAHGNIIVKPIRSPMAVSTIAEAMAARPPRPVKPTVRAAAE